MTDVLESVPLFIGEEPMRQMLTVLCRRYPGKAILADGDDERQRTKAAACARENGLPLILITAHPDCPMPDGIRAVCLERPVPFPSLRQLLDELCGTPAETIPEKNAPSLLWDKPGRILRCRGQSVSLTEREAALFDMLWSAAPGFVPVQQLQSVFQRTDGNGPQVYITYLRRKLSQLPLSVHITSRRGEGYALLIPEDESL